MDGEYNEINLGWFIIHHFQILNIGIFLPSNFALFPEKIGFCTKYAWIFSSTWLSLLKCPLTFSSIG